MSYGLWVQRKKNKSLNSQLRTPNHKGFTLVELLISIGIMAVVFGVIISSTSQIQKQGRDTQRQADLRNIQGSLQQYYADQGYYPASLGSSITGGGRTYLASVPKDPSTGNGYGYAPYATSGLGTCDNSSSPKCNYYELCATLENGPANSSCAGAPSTYNLKVIPQ